MNNLEGFLSAVLKAVWDNLDAASDIVAVAVTLVFVAQLQVTKTPVTLDSLAAVILTVLTLLAVSGLIEKRRRLNRIEEGVKLTVDLIDKRVTNRIRADEFFRVSDGETDSLLAQASVIGISGITLGNTTNRLSHVLTQRLSAGAHVRVMLLDSRPETLEQLVLRSWGPASTDYYDNRLSNTAEFLRILRRTARGTGRLEIGYLPFVPSFGLVLAGTDAHYSVAEVEVYHHLSESPIVSVRCN